MKFEEALGYLRNGKAIARCNGPYEGEYQLQFDFDNDIVIKTYCIEIWDLLADDWEIVDERIFYER